MFYLCLLFDLLLIYHSMKGLDPKYGEQNVVTSYALPLTSLQNAEDNQYKDGVKPSLEFVITSKDLTATGASATLLIFNNEIGFSPRNIESVCGVGRSTKKGKRGSGYIGEKGNE